MYVIEKINPIFFTYELWRNGPLTTLSIENRFYSIRQNKYKIRRCAEGYCNAENLIVRPKPECFAVMFFTKRSDYFWTHFTRKEFELCFLV